MAEQHAGDEFRLRFASSESLSLALAASSHTDEDKNAICCSCGDLFSRELSHLVFSDTAATITRNHSACSDTSATHGAGVARGLDSGDSSDSRWPLESSGLDSKDSH